MATGHSKEEGDAVVREPAALTVKLTRRHGKVTQPSYMSACDHIWRSLSAADLAFLVAKSSFSKPLERSTPSQNLPG